MQNTPLYDALIKHKNLARISFHTPGHKNNNKLINKDLQCLDYTELPDTDSLYESHGAIKDSEVLMSKTFGAKNTLFSAGGCTLCIQTMLKLALPYGGKIIASRMIHKSAVNTMALLNAQVIWLMPEKRNQSSFFNQTSADQIKEALSKNPDSAGVYITSPDYYGQIADIKNIAKICKRYNVPLLVDNAHGSHLKFLSPDIHPITLGADMVSDSIHKTLPVLTGGALLHIANEKYISKAKNAMSIFGSTSPSYPIMASIDLCGSWLRNYGHAAFKELEKEVTNIKLTAKEIGLVDNYDIADPVRITLNTAKVGIDGADAAEYFRTRGIEPEMSDNEHVVFIATPMNSKEDFINLKNAIKNLPVSAPLNFVSPIFTRPTLAKSLHDALFSKAEQIKTINACGRISSSTVCPCPPGIPILVPGEIINDKSIKSLLHYGIFLIDVLK